MNQALQDWYLATLGIVKYLPRDSRQPAPLEEPVPEPLPSPPLRRDALAPPSQPAETPQTEPVQAVETTGNELTVQASFSYAIWHPVDDLLVINDLAGEQTVSHQQLQLLANMLKAIKRWREPAGLPKTEYLKWPLQPGDTSASGASTLLSMFLSSRIKKHGVCWVLLMGQGTLKYLESVDREAPFIEMPGGAKSLTMPSLAEMLQNPALKKQAWLAIKPLVG